jgi:hypothetical protein
MRYQINPTEPIVLQIKIQKLQAVASQHWVLSNIYMSSSLMEATLRAEDLESLLIR